MLVANIKKKYFIHTFWIAQISQRKKRLWQKPDIWPMFVKITLEKKYPIYSYCMCMNFDAFGFIAACAAAGAAANM